MTIDAMKNMTAHQIGYATMTVLIITAFIFQAICFSFNNWYRMDIGPFMIRAGLWEMRIYDEQNITGLDAHNHEKSEFRFYEPIWKSVMDRIDKMGNTAPAAKRPKLKSAKPKATATKAPASSTHIVDRAGHNRDNDPDIDSDFTDMYNDKDYNELEHMNFKPGENWFNLPPHIPDTIWDQLQGDINAAQALYSITWLATFALMCLFAFHQFVPWFEVTIPIMRAFCATLFVTAFFAFVTVACYGNAMSPICKHITYVYENSPNPSFASAARESADCSHSAGYSMSILSGLCLTITGIMAAVRIFQIQRGENFDLGSAAGTAVSFGKSLLGGGVTSAIQRATGQQPAANGQGAYEWNQPPPATYSNGYDQGTYQPVGNPQGSNWERLE